MPYTFSSVAPSALTADKIFFKATLKKIGLGAPIDNLDKEFLKKKELFIHKKISGGGSIGMYIDRKKTTRKGYFTEEFLSGKILSLGVLESEGDYMPLGIVEIKLKNKKFYDKTAKYDEGFSSLISYKGKNVAKIQNITKAIFGFLGIRSCARIDFIEHKNKIFILEINSVPGLYIGSNLQYSAELVGLSFYELLIWILSRAQYDNL